MLSQEDPVVEPQRPWWRKLLDVLQNHPVIIVIAALIIICLYGAMLTSM
jgi:hypothetical protein